MKAKKRYKTWTKIAWDGNPSLNLECYRKSFRHGHVSVGIGAFKSIVYSYGPNSYNSMSGTRDRFSGEISEAEAMAEVDANKGLHPTCLPKG